MRLNTKHNRFAIAAALIALIAAAGVLQVRAISERSTFDKPYRVGTGEPILPPLPQSHFLRSYPMKFNGRPSDFAHYSSALSARDVIARYVESLASDLRGWVDPAYPAEHSMAAGCSVLSFARKNRAVVGIIAFDNNQGGSNYFVGEMPAGTAKSSLGESAGTEPSGVVKPLNSTRKLCIENLGGIESAMLFYDSWGRPSDIAEHMREGMAENGWRESNSSDILSRNYDGHAFLSFSRGRQQCIVGIDQEPKSGKMIILIFWCERRWLPEGTVL